MKPIQLKWNEGEQVVKFWESTASNRIGVQVASRVRRGAGVMQRSNSCSTYISKRNAKHLRDWLNKFLADVDAHVAASKEQP